MSIEAYEAHVRKTLTQWLKPSGGNTLDDLLADCAKELGGATNFIHHSFHAMRPAWETARLIYQSLPNTERPVKTHFHTEDNTLSDYDRQRLARVLHDPNRVMDMYRIGDGNHINVCGASFSYNELMATLRQLFPLEKKPVE